MELLYWRVKGDKTGWTFGLDSQFCGHYDGRDYARWRAVKDDPANIICLHTARVPTPQTLARGKTARVVCLSKAEDNEP